MPKKVLIIDDDAAVRHMLGRCLDTLGYSVRSFASAQDIASIKQAIYNDDDTLAVDAILSDVVMPGTTGIELMRVLASESKPLPPCALMSGAWTLDNLSVAQDLGCCIFEKPRLLPDICDWLRRCDRQQSAGADISRHIFGLPGNLITTRGCCTDRRM